MTHPPPPPLSRYAALGSDLEPAQLITRRLAACGFGVHLSHWRDQEELVILNVSGARSCLTLTSCGHARWHYEPSAGPVTDAATLAAIILHILSAASPPDRRSDVRAIRREGCPYQGFPLKGAVGRYLQDWGLTVTLRVDEDLESFEATSEIEVTSPARPRLGAVRLADDGHLDWECDYRAAFHGDTAALADIIAPILHTARSA